MRHKIFGRHRVTSRCSATGRSQLFCVGKFSQRKRDENVERKPLKSRELARGFARRRLTGTTAPSIADWQRTILQPSFQHMPSSGVKC
jgi:hypothetical protein